MQPFTCRFFLTVLLCTISALFIVGCDSNQAQNEIQTRSESVRNEPQANSNPNENATGDSRDENDSASQLIIDSNDSFALWVRGRLSVSSGTEDDELLFEIDPEVARARLWAALEVDGSLMATGSISTYSASILSILEAGDVFADSVKASEFETSNMDALEIVTEKIAAKTAEFETLKAQSVESDIGEFMDMKSEQLKSLLGSIGELDSGNLNASLASIDDASIQALAAINANVGTLVCKMMTCTHVLGDAIDVATIAAKSIEADMIEGTSISAQSLQATSASLSSLVAESIEAKNIASTLDRLSLNSSTCGIVTFPSIGADGKGRDETVRIHTSEDATGIIITPCSGQPQSEYLCGWEVKNLGNGTWEISRKLESAAIQAIENGTFTGESEVEIYWLAFFAN